MNIVNICPTCKESISTTPLVDILVTYQEDLTREEIYEQGWHKRCYPPALLAVLEMVEKRLQEKPGGVVAFTGEEWTQIDDAIAEAKGSDTPPRGQQG